MLRHQGVDALKMSIIVLVVCLVLSVTCTLISKSGINNILGASFAVVATLLVLSAGWVALWMPAEYFLYDGWPYQHDMRIYNQIADANFVIRERAGEVSAPLVEREVVQGQSLT